MNSHIAFIQDNLNIIHIPLDLYSEFLQPILRVLLPHGESSSEVLLQCMKENRHNFLNISITPTECSIICHALWAQKVFLPVINKLTASNDKPLIYPEAYTAFSMSTTNMDAGQRVIDLTAPLAIAGIPIFFITTCYTDFFLVCSTDRPAVVSTLLECGFKFSDFESAYVPPTYYALCRSIIPSNPLPSTVAELQARTFTLLKERSITPMVDPDIKLVMCCGRELSLDHDRYQTVYRSINPELSDPASEWISKTDSAVYLGVISALARLPRFLSITLALDDMPSLIMDKNLLRLFGDSIAGNIDTTLVPIFLDLSKLPVEITGIVCGVASLLVQELCDMSDKAGEKECELTELSYQSTARAGCVMLSEDQSQKALGALMPVLER